MAIGVTYWKADEGGYVGFMNDYPDYATQGETLDELKRMLVSLRRDIEGDIVPGIRHQTTLEYA